ncbi:MAG: transcription antitermination factor NusB [Clostridia bacterium]|nr:transcription antitermination factor NusB [Clostridia bacterium]
MSRRNARELVLHMIFDNECSKNDADAILARRLESEYFATLASEDELYATVPAENQKEYINTAVSGIIGRVEELDAYICKYASGWDISRISKVSKCILRLSMFEIKYMQIPVGASVNEALELTKKYDSEEAAPFVNGVLATFIKKEIENA